MEWRFPIATVLEAEKSLGSGVIQTSNGKRHYLFIFMFALLFSFSAFADGTCEDWFRGLKLKVGTKECELKCAAAENDMNSFDCSSTCEEFCKSPKEKKPCKLDDFWSSRLKGKTEPFGPLAGDELSAVKNALSRVPKSFRPSELKTFVRATADGGIASGFSVASSSDEYIILFPRAFLNLSKLPRIVAHELSHFLIEKEWNSLFKEYKKISGWDSLPGDQKYRKGNFVDSDGEDSPEEDFANNIEFFLFEPKVLEEQCPEIFRWINKKMGSQLKLEKGCQNEK